MASKKIFTSLAFQSGAKLIAPKVEARTPLATLTDPTDNNYYTGSAGQLAYNGGNIWVNNDSIWTKLLNHKTTATISGGFTFDRVDGNDAGIAPFIIGSSSQHKFVAGLQAETLGTNSATLSDGTHGISDTATEHGIPVYGASGVLPVGTPTEDGHAATKAYADSVGQGLTIIDPAYQATAAALPACTYANGTNGVGATLTGDANGALTIDGAAASQGKRVLVKDQSTAAHNGIYTVTNDGDESTAFVLTRATDYDTPAEINDGDFIFVQQGSTNANRGFVQTENTWSTAGTIGSSNIAWTQFSGAGQITAGDGLAKSGDTLSVDLADGTPLQIDSNKLSMAAIGVNDLADDAVTAAKLDDDGNFTMAKLGLGGSPTATQLGSSSWPTNALDVNGAIRLLGGGYATYAAKLTARLDSEHCLTLESQINDTTPFEVIGTYAGSGGASPRVVLSANGKPVGINVTDPSGTLHVQTARFGPHLITGDKSDYSVADGSATSSQYGWSLYGNNTSAISSEQLVITQGGGTNAGLVAYYYFTTSNPYSLAAALEVGKHYKVSISLKYSGTSAPSVRINDGSTYLSSFATLTTSLTTYTTTFEAKHASSAFIAFTGLPSGGTVTIDNLTLREDTLTTAGTLSVNAAADDLIVANNDNAGISVLSPNTKKGSIYFGDKDGSNRGVITFDHSNENLIFGLGGDGENERSILIDNSRNVKIVNGGLGVGAAAGAGGQGLMVDKSVDDDWVAKIKNSSNTTPYGLQVDCQGSNTVTAFAVYSSGNHFKVQPSHSYFSNKVAIGVLSSNTAPNKELEIGFTTNNSSNINLNMGSSGNGVLIENNATNAGSYACLDFRANNADGRIAYTYDDANTGAFHFVTDNANTMAPVFKIGADGTQDHKANSIINSATVAGLQDGGACYDFDGSADYIEGDDAGLPSGNTARTTSFWIRHNGTIDPYGAILNYGGTGTSLTAGSAWMVGWDDTNAKVIIGKYGGNASASSTTALTSGVWHHVAVTYDGTTVSYYLDGVADGTATFTADPNTIVGDSDNGKLRLGRSIARWGGGTQFFGGQIREVKIFPSALSAGDVRKLYSGENPKKNNNVELVTSWANGSSNGYDNFGTTASGLGISVQADSTGSEGAVSNSISVASGDVYLVSFNLTLTSGTAPTVSIASSNSGWATERSNTVVSAAGTNNIILTVTTTDTNAYLQFRSLNGQAASYSTGAISLTKITTLVDFNPQSASSTKWRNEALLGFYDGTVNNATLSQGNTYWNNIKQDGTNVESTELTLRKQFTNTTTVERLLTLDTHDKSAAIALNAGDGVGILFKIPEATDSAIGASIDAEKTDGLDANTSTRLMFRVSQDDETLDTALKLDQDLSARLYGNLGVGGEASTCQLRVVGTSEFENTIYLGTHTGSKGMFGWTDMDSSSAQSGNHNHLVIAGSADAASAGILFQTRYASTTQDAGVISREGNWGIKSTAPKALLDINSQSYAGYPLLIRGDLDANGRYTGIKFGLNGTGATNNYFKAAIQVRATTGYVQPDMHFMLEPAASWASVEDSDAHRVLSLRNDGTHDHQGNRIVNSQTLNDSWRSSEPSLRFDGVDDDVELGDSDAIATGTYITVSAWIKNEGTTIGRIFLAQKGAGSTAYSLQINSNNGSDAAGYISALTWNGSAHSYKSYDASLDDSNWHHVAMVLTSSTQDLYVDGVAVGTQGTSTFDNAASEHHAFIGSYNGSSQFFKGEIKDVRIHNRAMEANEVKGLYNGEATPWLYADAGVELISNGTFSDTSSWTLYQGTNATTSFGSGVITISNSSSSTDFTGFSQEITTEVGKIYKVTFTATVTNGAFYFKDNNTNTTEKFHDSLPITGTGQTTPAFTSSGTYTKYFVADYTTTKPLWGRSTANGNTINVSISNISIVQVGEVAAYTPQGIRSSLGDNRWHDSTSNANHGSISGATFVGVDGHLGTLVVKGRSEAGDDDNNTAGCIKLGHSDDKMARFDYDPASTSSLRIDNTHDDDAAEIEFGLQTSGSRVIPMQLLGDGTVKARSSSSGNLKQVARVHSENLNGTGSDKDFIIVHNLGTPNIVVSVRSRNAPFEQVECAVMCNENTSSTDTNSLNKCLIRFATAPANNSTGEYKVTVIG